MRAQEMRRHGSSRPLRWPKFGGALLLAIPAVGAAAAPLRLIASAAASGYVAAPPLAAFLPSAAFGVAALFLLFILGAEAALDFAAPRWILPALAGVFVVQAAIPAASDDAVEGAERLGSTAMEALLHRIQLEAREWLEERGTLSGAAPRLQGALASLPALPYLQRSLGALPPIIEVIEGADGPILSPTGGRPGVIYLAIAPSGTVGWLTASGLREGENRIVRAAERPLVLPIVRCGPQRGAASC